MVRLVYESLSDHPWQVVDDNGYRIQVFKDDEETLARDFLAHYNWMSTATDPTL